MQVTGPVALEDPYIAADQLAGLDPGSPTAASARLTTSVALVNAGGAALRCVLVASIAEAPHTSLREGATLRGKRRMAIISYEKSEPARHRAASWQHACAWLGLSAQQPDGLCASPSSKP